MQNSQNATQWQKLARTITSMALHPPHLVDRSALIAGARQAVLFGKNIPQAQRPGVADWVTQSWLRCLSQGMQPARAVGFDIVSTAMQKRHAEANLRLISAAQPTITQLGEAIAQTRYFAIVTNRDGVVVSAAGAIDKTDRRAQLISRVGANLSESAVGTTAIGATLAQQQTTWLHRGEHFFDDTQCYSCAGAPIIGPQGECVGMLDVTGIDVPERPELTHLVASSARSIENALVLATPHVLVLHLYWPGQHGGKDTEGLMCLDADGTVRALNPAARRMLGSDAQPHTVMHAEHVFACNWTQFFDEQSRSSAWVVPLWSGLQVCVRSSLAGRLAPKSGLRSLAASLAQPLKEHETALIRQTVQDKRGNVAAAAKALGISRATVYRKLANR